MALPEASSPRQPQLAAKPLDVGTPLQPARALRALRHLIADKDDTVQVFEIIEALSGKAFAKGYRRMLRSPEGGRQAYLAHEFGEQLQNAEWLRQFAPGTVGDTYRTFMERQNITAYGLIEVSREQTDPDVDAAHPIAWYARRLRDVHDVWHVLTGYGTDTLGEACLLGFTYAQTAHWGVGFIAVAAAYELTKSHGEQPCARAIAEGWRAGRKAGWLPALDYTSLFEQPLDVARKTLNIADPSTYRAIPASITATMGNRPHHNAQAFG